MAIVYNEVEYKSVYALAKAFGFTDKDILQELYKENNAVKAIDILRKARTIALDYDLDEITLRKNLRKYNGDIARSIKSAEVREATRAKPVTYNGKSFNSIGALCKALNLSRSSVYKLRETGLSTEEAVNKLVSENKVVDFSFSVGNFKFDSINIFAKRYGLTLSSVKAVSKEVNLDAIKLLVFITRCIKKNKGVRFGGRYYKSLNELSLDFSVSVKSVQKLITDGYSLNEAISIIKSVD